MSYVSIFVQAITSDWNARLEKELSVKRAFLTSKNKSVSRHTVLSIDLRTTLNVCGKNNNPITQLFRVAGFDKGTILVERKMLGVYNWGQETIGNQCHRELRSYINPNK